MNPDHRHTAALAVYLQMRDGLRVAPQPALALPGSVIAYALGRAVADRAAVEQALATNLALRGLYRQALDARCIARSARQACAQDQAGVAQREGDHFRLYFRTSRAAPEQVYVTFEAGPALALQEGDVVEIHAIGEHEVLSVRFPALHDSRSQRLFESCDAVLRLLRDDRAELELARG